MEKEIARKIVEISKTSRRVVVNLTGGEPTMAQYIEDVISILGKVENIELQLISNLKTISRIETLLPLLSHVMVSLHISYRKVGEIDKMIRVINRNKDIVTFSLSQVDVSLTDPERKELARIESETGLPITFQTFIPPWTEKGKVKDGDKITDKSFEASRGKYCSLGYFYFFIHADGTLKYDLWCNEKTSRYVNLLSLKPGQFEEYILDDMKKCPQSSCGCNYNYFNHKEYMEECKKLGYPEKDIFVGSNTRFLQRVLRRLSRFKAKYLNTR